MVNSNDTIKILESINQRLNLRTVINTDMVDTWHGFLKKHDIAIIKKAIERIAIEWESNSFPKPKHFRDYLALAKNEENVNKAPFEIGPEDVSSMSSRVSRLRQTSQNNIDRRARNKDKSREPCAKCGKPALMNLTADDYCHYWNHPLIESLKGKYLCGRCTDRLNVFLKDGVSS